MNNITTPLCGEQNKITGFHVKTPRPATWLLTEFVMDLPREAAGRNVYREEEIAVKAQFALGSHSFAVDGFYCEGYELSDTAVCVGRTAEPPVFCVRAAFPQAGCWQVTVSLLLNGETIDTLQGCVNIEESGQQPRLLSVEPTHRQVFMTPTGDPVSLVGENLTYLAKKEQPEPLGERVVRQIKELAAHGVNHVRLCDDVRNGATLKESVFRMRQDVSAMWDCILETAAAEGVYVTFTLFHFMETKSVFLKNTPWHVDNGGFLQEGVDFFGDADTVEAVRCYIRYVVARYGYSQQIFAFELFDEIDRGDALEKGRHAEVLRWQDEMIALIRERDPHGHLVSNSIFVINLFARYYPPLDFVYYHQRCHAGVSHLADMQKNNVRAYGRPALIGDSGMGYASAAIYGGIVAPDLLVMHQNNWLGVMGGGAGTAMNVDWEAAHAYGGMALFDAVSAMAKRIPWRDPSLRTVTEETVSLSQVQNSVLGYLTETGAYLWFYDNNLAALWQQETVFTAATAAVPLPAGDYTVRWYDTHTGAVLREESVTAQNGTVTLSMPTWSKDIAVTVTR